MYCSAPYEHVITSVAWSPSGDTFAVGSYNLLRLCDKAGWSQSFSKPDAGSIMKLDWNVDGTAVAGAGVYFSFIIGKWKCCFWIYNREMFKLGTN